MPKMLLLIALSFFSIMSPCQIQDAYNDSLLRVIENSKQDTVKLTALIDLYKYYFNSGDYHASLNHCRNALSLAKSIQDNKEARITYAMGLIFTSLTQYDSAKHYLDKSEVLFLEANDMLGLIYCYNAHGLLCNYQSDYSGAVEFFIRSADLIEKQKKDTFQILQAQAYGNIGHNLIAENQIEKGIEYHKKALTYKGYPEKKRFDTQIYLDIFDAYVKLKNLPVAKIYLDSAKALQHESKNIYVNALIANNEGFYYETLDSLDNALDHYLKAYKLCDSTQNDYLKAEVGENIAKIYFRRKHHVTSEDFALTANAIARRLKNYKVAAGTYDLLKQVAENRNDYKKALEYASLNKFYADSATNAATQKETLALESKYRHQKKEKEILALKKINAEKELAVIKRNRILITGGIIAMAVFIILGLLYRNSKQKQIIAKKEQMLQREQIKFLERQQQIVSLQSMVNGQEIERTRIARDLHDGLGGLFSTVKMNLSTLQHEVSQMRENQLFQKSFDLVDTASIEVRRIAHNLMPEVLTKLGLINAIRDLCMSINAGKLLHVTLQVHGMNGRLNPSTEVMLFRIVQELLNNIIKHAQATQAIIQFTKDESRLSVVVEDNGKGFNTMEADENKHAGIETIKSRVNYLNGKLTIDSQQNIGTTVMMDFLIND